MGLVEALKRQAAPFHPVYHLGQMVTGLSPREGGWRVETSAGTRIDCRAVIVAAGCGAFGPNRPPLEGLEQYEGTSVFYYVTEREAFRGQRVMIAGGGDSAVDWALSLHDIAEVAVVHRRDKFRAAPESVARMRQLAEEGKITLLTGYQLGGLEGATGRLDAVELTDLEGGARRVETDALLPFFGLAMNLGPIAEWGLDLERSHITVDPVTMQTSAEGVYAIGDIATYPGKLKLILTGFAEAAQACHAIYPHVQGRELHFEYSTTKGIPEAA